MKPELLAPAGSLEKLKFAYLYGADACYVGGTNFSLRANAQNFSNEELLEATTLAHSMGKKIYVTVNIVFHNDDLEGLREYLQYLAQIKVDGIIASDIAVMKMIRDEKIDLDVHVSTQASITNYEAALFYKELGAHRLVLAREASREDIKRIKAETGLELETFIHGAMCTSFSGRCVLSNYCTNRDSNRGGCAQICRFEFSYLKDGKPLTAMPFSMTPKDLNMVPFIAEMMAIGIDSFKIEGRMRSIYYVSTVILIYRRLIDKICNKTLTSEYTSYCLNVLNRVANRESTPQFFDHLPGTNEQYYLGRQELSNQDFLGLVIDYQDGVATIEERNYFEVGQTVQFFGPDIETFNYTITEIFDADGNAITKAQHAQMIVKLKVPRPLKQFDMMRVKMFDF